MSAGTVILLCNLTMSMAEPWVSAGYRVVLVDPQHPVTESDGLVERISDTVLGAAHRLSEIIRTERVVFVAGFPPCTDVAVSGSKHFEAKRKKDPHFQTKAALVAEQCRMTGLLSGAPWVFENPVSVFSSIFGESDHGFHPWWFTGICVSDNYTKNTRLWCSPDFVMPMSNVHPMVQKAVDYVISVAGKFIAKPKALELLAERNAPPPEDVQLVREWYPDDRIHKAAPGDDRANFRSATPRGFAQACFEANAPHLQHWKQMKLEAA